MKLLKASFCAAVASVCFLGTSHLIAQDAAATLTRGQWLQKVGASVSNDEVLRATMVQVAPGDKVEFTRRIIKAATRLPVSPDEKGAALVKSAVACIAGADNGVKQQVIAEVLAGIPIEYLPVVTEELAKRFDQSYNSLSNEQYEKIATETVEATFKRNAETDAPSVRNTFAILAFLRGAKDPALQNRLIALLPDERMRNLAASWIPPALKEKNYDALLAAADIDHIAIRHDTLLRLVGHSNLDRLLADLNANLVLKHELHDDETGTNAVPSVWVPLSEMRAVSGIVSARTSALLDHGRDYGINRVPQYPQGYQNQSTSIIPDRRK